MSLQDDVNNQVAAIHQQLAEAQAANPPNTVVVSFESIRTALGEAANAIDTLGGDSASLRASIEGIEDVEVDLLQLNAAMGSHLGASASIVDLLINQSNFDGASQ
jgi:hypothetical protein